MQQSFQSYFAPGYASRGSPLQYEAVAPPPSPPRPAPQPVVQPQEQLREQERYYVNELQKMQQRLGDAQAELARRETVAPKTSLADAATDAVPAPAPAPPVLASWSPGTALWAFALLVLLVVFVLVIVQITKTDGMAAEHRAAMNVLLLMSRK